MLSDRFREAVESGDTSAAEELLAPDVSFHSPAVYKPYEGREATMVVLGAVERLFEGFRYVHQVETGDVAMLMFEARVGDREIAGIDLLRFDEEGRIAELRVFIRPLSGLNAVLAGMGELLAGERPDAIAG